MYKPQVNPFDISRATRGSEKEHLIISKDLVEIEELDFLGHMYKEQDGEIFLDPTLAPVCPLPFYSFPMPTHFALLHIPMLMVSRCRRTLTIS
jgi:hypothetical protein